MSNYFTINEFIYSATALRYNIDNTPTQEVVNHFYELLPLLNEIRYKWGGPVRITSGYRCKLLNRMVGGVENSDHTLGYAADIQPVSGEFEWFVELIKSIFKNRKDFNQIIIESNGRTRWVHVSVKGKGGVQKGQIFNINK